MKRPRINLILGKKHLVAAGLALVLAVGLYANFAIGSSADGKNVSGDNYGDTRLVSNEKSKTQADTDKDSDIVATAAKSDIRSDSASDSEEYFAKARIDKQASREEAKETLKSIYGGGDMTKDELAVVAQDAKQLTDLMEAENKIETTLKAQGFEEGWIAGAIISGAYFGDKVSPLSDTTILASSVTDTPRFTHIRYMMYTTVPAVVISLVIFTVAGFSHEASDSSQIAVFTTGLAERFHITFWVLLVPVVTGILIARKVSSIITLFVSTALAVICMLVFQTDVLREVAGDGVNGGEALYKGVLLALSGSTSLQTSTPALTELIATRGMGGMMDTVWLILCAMCLGGAMTACGMLGSITRMFVRFTHKLASTVAATVASGLFLNLATADQYISIILTGNMFKDIYKKNGYESRLLSRTTEDAVTVTSPLIPWNTCGMTQATILNVPTLVYLPYSFFNLLSPLMSILVACIGFKIVRSVKKD